MERECKHFYLFNVLIDIEYWSELHALLQENLPNPEIEPMSLMSPALAGGFFTSSTTWEALTMESMGLQRVENDLAT